MIKPRWMAPRMNPTIVSPTQHTTRAAWKRRLWKAWKRRYRLCFSTMATTIEKMSPMQHGT